MKHDQLPESAYAYIIAELRAEFSMQRATIRAKEDRLNAACQRVELPYMGCDSADCLAGEILGVRARLREVTKNNG